MTEESLSSKGAARGKGRLENKGAGQRFCVRGTRQNVGPANYIRVALKDGSKETRKEKC